MKPREKAEGGFLEQLSQLRRCLLRILLAIMIGMALSLLLSRDLLLLITAPAGRLVVLRPAEFLLAQLKVALINGLVISLPVTFWLIGQYLWPALYPAERRTVALYLPLGLILFLIGVAFGFLLVVRLGYNFLLSLVPPTMHAQITLDNYLSFMLSSALACGLIFLLPVLVLLLVRLGLLKAAFLWRQQRIVILVLLIVVAVITPTVDILSLVLVFLPLFLLFELSVLLAWIMERRRARRGLS